MGTWYHTLSCAQEHDSRHRGISDLEGTTGRKGYIYAHTNAKTIAGKNPHYFDALIPKYIVTPNPQIPNMELMSVAIFDHLPKLPFFFSAGTPD